MTSASPERRAHGGNGARLAEELGLDPASVLDLSASLCPVAPDPTATVQRHLGAVGRYPDPERATAALACPFLCELWRCSRTNRPSRGVR